MGVCGYVVEDELDEKELDDKGKRTKKKALGEKGKRTEKKALGGKEKKELDDTKILTYLLILFVLLNYLSYLLKVHIYPFLV